MVTRGYSSWSRRIGGVLPFIYPRGGIAESTVGYFWAFIPHLDVAHFPERGAEPEVDFIVTIGIKRIPIKVKYRRRIDPLEDTVGLRAFLEKHVYNTPFARLITLDDNGSILDPRIIPISLSSFLWIHWGLTREFNWHLLGITRSHHKLRE